MSMDWEPPNHIQHQNPPTFYCWKYWLTTGQLHEGCKRVEASPQNFLDLNLYGWVYIVLPVVGLFLFVFIFYCLCRGKSHEHRKQLVPDESDSEDEDYRSKIRSSGPHRGIPVRSVDANKMYTVVSMDPNESRKMPLQGGVDTGLYQPYVPQQRMYPRLTAMRQQAGLNGKGKTSSNSRPKSVEASHPANVYHPESALRNGSKTSPKRSTPPNEVPADVEHHQETSSEESEEEQ